jgi:hypothetical protein
VDAGGFTGSNELALHVGKVINAYKVARHIDPAVSKTDPWTHARRLCHKRNSLGLNWSLQLTDVLL